MDSLLLKKHMRYNPLGCGETVGCVLCVCSKQIPPPAAHALMMMMDASVAVTDLPLGVGASSDKQRRHKQ